MLTVEVIKGEPKKRAALSIPFLFQSYHSPAFRLKRKSTRRLITNPYILSDTATNMHTNTPSFTPDKVTSDVKGIIEGRRGLLSKSPLHRPGRLRKRYI